MAPDTADKIAYWQTMHREAGQVLCFRFQTFHNGDGHWLDYWSGQDWAYVKAWQERQAYCYRQIVRQRGF